MGFMRRSVTLAVAALAIGFVACEEMVEKQEKRQPVVLSRDIAEDVAAFAQEYLVQTLLDGLSSPGTIIGIGATGPVEEPGEPGEPGPAAVSREHVAGAAAETLDACTMMDPGMPVDSDGDEIPLSLKVVFDCSDGSSRFEGTVVIKDKDDSDRDSGFSADVDLRTESPDEAGGRVVVRVDYVVDVNRIASPGATALGYDISYEGKITFDVRGMTIKFSFDIDGKHEGTRAAGVVSIDGKYGYAWAVDCTKAIGESAAECRRFVQSSGSKGELQLTIKASRLEYDTVNCSMAPMPITSGVLEVRDNAGNVVGIRYAGCDQVTVTHNGEPLELGHTTDRVYTRWGSTRPTGTRIGGDGSQVARQFLCGLAVQALRK